jgi:bifunctional UDP-N-acetylglucosamine pyrophosphorylase/glucosamine-1-phosphate N-acetyltransferase
MIGVILAAGIGKRMKSKYPKALYEILGKKMIDYPLDTLSAINDLQEIIIVVSKDNRKLIEEHITTKEQRKKILFVEQPKQLGTAHALLQVQGFVQKYDKLLVLPTDLPLIKKETIINLMKNSKDYNITLLTARVNNPSGFGRILREDTSNKVIKIVEETELDESQKTKLKEINVGIYIFKTDFIFSILPKIRPDNKQNEYYLTDAIESEEEVNAVELRDEEEIIGVNTKEDLIKVENILRERKIKALLLEEGVRIIDPENTYIDYQVKINKDVVIYPYTMILGDSVIDEDSIIGPYTYIINCEIGKGVEIVASFVKNSIIKDKVKIGPFSHIRPQVLIEEEAKIGNFVEVKKSKIGKGTKAMHLSYLGDSEIASKVNIGAGTIICNYDGIRKHKTVIEEGAFIGSNTALIAPVTVHKSAVIGAGSTITQDVPAFALAIGRARQRNIKDWVLKRENNKKNNEE